MLRQKEIGKFVQIPVRLAYAITVHKSQGLSLGYVDLKLGSGCFTHGQLYTALSRCRTLEGLRIDRTIMKEDLILDAKVVSFYKSLDEPMSASKAVPINVPLEYLEAVQAYLAHLKAQKGIAREPPSILAAPLPLGIQEKVPLQTQNQEERVKNHRYWSIVESVRVGKRTFKRQALYLGELNDSQAEGWRRSLEALDDSGAPKYISLFPRKTCRRFLRRI